MDGPGADAAVGAGDEEALGRWLASGLVLGATPWTLIRGARYSGYRIVAFAKLGAQRLVKTRLDGAASSAVVLARWASFQGSWHVAALDVVGREGVRPA